MKCGKSDWKKVGRKRREAPKHRCYVHNNGQNVRAHKIVYLKWWWWWFARPTERHKDMNLDKLFMIYDRANLMHTLYNTCLRGEYVFRKQFLFQFDPFLDYFSNFGSHCKSNIHSHWNRCMHMQNAITIQFECIPCVPCTLYGQWCKINWQTGK